MTATGGVIHDYSEPGGPFIEHTSLLHQELLR